MLVPNLETARLHLRPLNSEHAPDYQKHFVHPEVLAYLSRGIPSPYPSDGAREFIEKIVTPQQGRDRWNWAIMLQERPDELIGAIEISRIPNPTHRGFWLGRPFWGHGYMTEAADRVTRFAFEELGFEKLIVGHAVENERSRRVKIRSGARLIGQVPGEFMDPSLKILELWEITNKYKGTRDA